MYFSEVKDWETTIGYLYLKDTKSGNSFLGNKREGR
jgi:hypothetical protein